MSEARIGADQGEVPEGIRLIWRGSELTPAAPLHSLGITAAATAEHPLQAVVVLDAEDVEGYRPLPPSVSEAPDPLLTTPCMGRLSESGGWQAMNRGFEELKASRPTATRAHSRTLTLAWFIRPLGGSSKTRPRCGQPKAPL